LADIFDAQQRVRMQGIFGAVFGLSSVIGPTFGGYITDNWGWRWVFYVNIPVGVLAVAVTLAALPYVRSKVSWREIDFVGAAMLAAGVIPLLIGLSITHDHSWTSPEVLALLAGAAAMLAGFFVVETRWARNPVVPFELFKTNQFAISVTVAFFTAVGMFGAIIFIPLLYQGVLGVSATNSGNLLIPMMGGLVVFSTLSGQLLSRIRYYRVLGTVGIGAMIVAMWLLTGVTAGTSQWTVSAYSVILGAGLGLTFPLTLAVVQVALPQRVVGVATSQVQFWRNLGGTVGTAVLGSILSRQLTPDIQARITALHLPRQFSLPSTSASSPQAALDPKNLAQTRASLPTQFQPLFDQVVHAMRLGLADAIHDVFLIGAAILVVALVATLFLREVPIKRGRQAVAPELEVDDGVSDRLRAAG
jgi:EmrB/QacA subfamily drug resistance transporter